LSDLISQVPQSIDPISFFSYSYYLTLQGIQDEFRVQNCGKRKKTLALSEIWVLEIFCNVAKDQIFFTNISKLFHNYFEIILQSGASQFLQKSRITQFFPQSLQKYWASLAQNVCNPFQEAFCNSPGPGSGRSSPAGAGCVTIAKQFCNSCQKQPL
jgi:hypothetical protein